MASLHQKSIIFYLTLPSIEPEILCIQTIICCHWATVPPLLFCTHCNHYVIQRCCWRHVDSFFILFMSLVPWKLDSTLLPEHGVGKPLHKHCLRSSRLCVMWPDAQPILQAVQEQLGIGGACWCRWGNFGTCPSALHLGGRILAKVCFCCCWISLGVKE